MKIITNQSNLIVVEIPAKDFKIRLVDTSKKTAHSSNFSNAGFFANYVEGTSKFTLPVGHVKCEFDSSNKWTKHYCSERGTIISKTFTYSQSKKTQTVLYVTNGSCGMTESSAPPSGCTYAIAGVPVLRNSKAITWSTAKQQGWDTSCLYATWHIFAGLKSNRSTVYLAAMKTTSSNLMTSGEGARKLLTIGFTNAIKLDGGGSTILNVSGKNYVCTPENRRICTIITFDGTTNNSSTNTPSVNTTTPSSKNPYPVPTRALTQGCKGNDVKWLQWELVNEKYNITIDGSVGPATKTALKDYQSKHNLTVDGSCGPATRKELLK